MKTRPFFSQHPGPCSEAPIGQAPVPLYWNSSSSRGRHSTVVTMVDRWMVRCFFVLLLRSSRPQETLRNVHLLGSISIYIYVCYMTRRGNWTEEHVGLQLLTCSHCRDSMFATFYLSSHAGRRRCLNLPTSVNNVLVSRVLTCHEHWKQELFPKASRLIQPPCVSALQILWTIDVRTIERWVHYDANLSSVQRSGHSWTLGQAS